MSARIEIVRRALEALNAGDIEALVDPCDADFRLDMIDRVLNPSLYEGHNGIRAFYAEVLEVWESFTWEPVELHEVDDLVVAVLQSSGKGRGSGLVLDRRSSAMLWRVDDERALSLTFYRDPMRLSRGLEEEPTPRTRTNDSARLLLARRRSSGTQEFAPSPAAFAAARNAGRRSCHRTR